MRMRLALLQSDVPGMACRRGKVRDVYDLRDRLVIVATDRIESLRDLSLAGRIAGTRHRQFPFAVRGATRMSRHPLFCLSPRSRLGRHPSGCQRVSWGINSRRAARKKSLP